MAFDGPIRQDLNFTTLELADEAFGGVKVQADNMQQLSWLDGHGSRRRALANQWIETWNQIKRLFLSSFCGAVWEAIVHWWNSEAVSENS